MSQTYLHLCTITNLQKDTNKSRVCTKNEYQNVTEHKKGTYTSIFVLTCVTGLCYNTDIKNEPKEVRYGYQWRLQKVSLSCPTNGHIRAKMVRFADQHIDIRTAPNS